MILSIGKKNWSKERFIHIDKVSSFKLVFEDGTEYPIGKEQIEFVMGTPEQYDASKGIEDDKAIIPKSQSAVFGKTEFKKKDKKDEVQDND